MIFHAPFFVLKICREFTALAMVRDGRSIMENRDMEALFGIAGEDVDLDPIRIAKNSVRFR